MKYVGEKHTVIEYDEKLHQWNMTVTNQPSIQGFSSTDLASLSVGTHSWTILGDPGCHSKPRTIKLSLRKLSSTISLTSSSSCDDMLVLTCSDMTIVS